MAVVLPHPPKEYNDQYFRDLIQRLEFHLNEVIGEGKVVKDGYSRSNVTEDRTVDGATKGCGWGGIGGSNDVFTTLINDMIEKGLLKET